LFASWGQFYCSITDLITKLPIAIFTKISYNYGVNIRIRWFFLPTLLILLISLAGGIALAQSNGPIVGDELYVPETGHYVTGDFLHTYLSVQNPEIIFGYPITDAYQEQNHSRIVQYFEKARFELFPENPPELRVVITPLGEFLYIPGAPLPVPDTLPDCRTFPETGFEVCYAFRHFFESHGGAAIFGYPISNFEIQNQRIVQYFQRSRFEWHPERKSTSGVILGNLGREYFYEIQEDPIRLMPQLPTDNIPHPVLSLRVRAFPDQAVVPQTGEQTIYIIVQDQRLLPVENAEITLLALLPTGELRPIEAGYTNPDGVARYTFEFANQATGQARVLAIANYGDLQENTVTSFRIWW
jgi:hypothetical protein